MSTVIEITIDLFALAFIGLLCAGLSHRFNEPKSCHAHHSGSGTAYAAPKN